MEIISVRQENRSTDFLEEKWLNFWKKYNTILIIAGKDCCCTVPKRNWHFFLLHIDFFRLTCCTVPKRNWHFLKASLFARTSSGVMEVVPYLRGIDTQQHMLTYSQIPEYRCTVPKRNWHVHSDCTSRVFLDGLQQVVPYLRGIDTFVNSSNKWSTNSSSLYRT